MATTTNYSWTTPDDTALVKDGAAAIRSLGTAIDTTVFNNAGASIAKTIVDAKGDIIAATAADTVSRLAVGANGTVLTAASGQATGLEWALPASGGMTLISTTTLSGASTTLSSIPQTYNSLLLIVSGVTGNTSDQSIRLLPNNVSNLSSYVRVTGSAVTTVNSQTLAVSCNRATDRTSANNVYGITIDNYASTTTYKPFNTRGFQVSSGGTLEALGAFGAYRETTAITSLVFDYAGQTFAGGTVLLYGVK